ncbi:MAG: hypothetical protein ABSH34_07275 [Verrucomicrobiota bacterium]|jgi:hypothetical protein
MAPKHKIGWLGPGVAALAILASGQGRGQDALEVLKATQAAAEVRRASLEYQSYTLKADELRMLVATSLEVDWNDNINLAQNDAESDFIVRPMGHVAAFYPVTQNSLLSLNVLGGYDKYLAHDNFSYWHLGSGSGLVLDLDVGQFTFDMHDRMEYLQDSAQQAAVAGTSSSGLRSPYGYFQNVAGVLGMWQLNDVVPSLGYDHENFIASSSAFNYATRATEDFYARTAFQVHPRLTVGPEATAGLTTYQEKVLNDNTGLSAGLFGDWRPNSALRVMLRAGYAVYLFEQTSRLAPPVKTSDQDSWYLDLTARHQVTDTITANLSAGHELLLGVQSELVDAWYVRPGLAWRVAREVTAQGSAFYEHGSQDLGALLGNLHENYDWEGVELGLAYSPWRDLKMSVDYRLTFRSSDLAFRTYTQDLVGVLVTYTFK